MGLSRLRHCSICDAIVTRGTLATKYCDKCAPHTYKIRYQKCRRAKAGKPPLTKEQIMELVRYYWAKEEGLKPRKPEFLYDKKEETTGVRRCAFCGNLTNNRKYCKVCRAQGFDELHAETGRSNGWDSHLRAMSLTTKNRDSNSGGNFYTSFTTKSKEDNYEIR